MLLKDFVSQHIEPQHHAASQPTAYLAQHGLFDQIPELRNDVIIPDYCCTSGSANSMLKINAWFGPGGTISPLHHDPYKNLLAQVVPAIVLPKSQADLRFSLTQLVGRKFIRLFHPRETDKLAAYDEPLLCNTSRIDVEQPDLKAYPGFANAEAWVGFTKGGELKHWQMDSYPFFFAPFPRT